MKKSFLIIGAIIALGSHGLFSNEELPLNAKGQLLLHDAMRMVIQNNLDLKIKNLTPIVRELQVKAERGEFEPRIFLSTTYEDFDQKQNAISFSSTEQNLNNPDPLNSVYGEKNIRLNSGLEGKLFTGTEYHLQIGRAMA